MMLSALCVATMATLRAQTGKDEKFACPTDLLLVDGSCMWYDERPKGWYEAEVSCRQRGGNLAHLSSDDVLRQISSRSDIEQAWMGLTGESGEWKFSNYEPTSIKITLADPVPGMHCGSIRNGNIVSSSCNEQKPYFCSVASGMCLWRKISDTLLVYSNGNFGPGGMASTVTLDPSTMILKVDEEEAGIGSWVGPSTFVVESPKGLACKYTIQFNQGFVMNGCDGQLTRSEWIMSSSDLASFCAELPGPSPTTSIWTTPEPTSPPTPRPVPITAKPGTEFRPTGPPGPSDDSDDNYGIPTWAWPLAIISVAAASAVAAVGAVNRKKKKATASTSSEEGVHAMVPVSAEGIAAAKAAGMDCTSAECEICVKFNETTARQRLLAVHQALTRELSMPLVVSGTRCDHVGGEHIHVFNVENDFDSHTLGALSTVYSRTKPRLPRNTRIHIVHKKERQTIEQGHVDFAGDHAYIADAYY